MHHSIGLVRSVTRTDASAPLAPQNYGYDVKGYDDEEHEDKGEAE